MPMFLGLAIVCYVLAVLGFIFTGKPDGRTMAMRIAFCTMLALAVSTVMQLQQH